MARRLIIRRASLRSHGPVGQLAGLPVDGAEEGGFLLAGDACGLEVGVEVLLGVVVGGHLVPLAALLVQAEPGPRALGVIVLDLHAEGGADAGEAEDHDADQGPVAQADRAVRRCRWQSSELSRASSAVSTGVLPCLTTCLGPRTELAGLKSA